MHMQPSGAGKAWGGQRHGQPHQCLWLPGVLSQDQGRCAGGVWDGHQSGAAGPQAQEEGRLPAAVRRRSRSAAEGGLPQTHRKLRETFKSKASWDYIYITNTDMPQANMKDWHTCLKAKQISFFYTCFNPYSHCLVFLFAVCLFVFSSPAYQPVCARGQPPCPVYECICIYMCIYFTYISLSSCVMIVYREGPLSSHTHQMASSQSTATKRQTIILMKYSIRFALIDSKLKISHGTPASPPTACPIHFLLCTSAAVFILELFAIPLLNLHPECPISLSAESAELPLSVLPSCLCWQRTESRAHSRWINSSA